MADESKVLIQLRLIGAALFKRQTGESSKGLERIERTGRSAGRGLKATGTGGQAASVALRRVQKVASQTNMGLTTLRSGAQRTMDTLKRVSAVAAITAGIGLAPAIGQAVGFEQAMAKVQSRLLLTKGEMGSLNKLALDLGGRTNYSAREAAGAMDELAAQGFNANQIMRVLPGTISLAAASGADLAQAAAIQTETLHAFGLEAGRAGHVADVLAQISNKSAADIDDMQESLKYIAPVAKASGQSLLDVGAAVGLLSNVGIKGSQSGTTLRTAMVRLANPTDKARKALRTLNLSAGDLAGKDGLLSLPNIMTKLSAGAQGVSKNQRNAALATIFGREALSGMVTLVEQGPAKLRKLSDALRDSGGAAKRAADIQRATVAGAWDSFTGAIESASIALTSGMMPALRGVLNFAAQGIPKLVKDLGRVGAAVRAGQKGSGQGYGGVAGAAADVSRRLPGIKGAKNGLMAGLAGRSGAETAGFTGVGAAAVKVGNVLRQVGRGAMDVGRQLLDAFKPAQPFLENVIVPLLTGVAKGVIGSVVAAFKVVVPVIKVTATVLGWLGKQAAPLKGVFQGIGMVIGFIFSGAILKVIGLLPKLGFLAKIAALPIKVLGLYVRGVAKVLSVAAGPALRGFAAGLQFVNRWLAFNRSAFGKALAAVTNFASGVVGRLARVPGQARAKIAALISGIRSKLGEGASKVVGAATNIGKAIVNAIVNAIKAAPGQISAAVLSVVPEKARGPLKDALGFVTGGGAIGALARQVEGRAKGGVVRSPLQVVGEHGPELAALPIGTRVMPAHQTRSMVGRRVPEARAMPQRIVIHNLMTVGPRVLWESVRDVERQLAEAT